MENITAEEWDDFFSSPAGAEFINMLKIEEETALNGLVGCPNIETYKGREGYIFAIRNVLSEIAKLRKGAS